MRNKIQMEKKAFNEYNGQFIEFPLCDKNKKTIINRKNHP